MRVLAIDPGYDRIGIAVMERDGQKDVLIHSACIETTRGAETPIRLAELGEAIVGLLKTHKPDVMAVETLFFNQNRSTAIAVAEARGIVLYLAVTHGADVREYGPQEIKVAVTGYGKSDKRAVIDMIKRLVPTAPARALDDEYDAIAVGITALAHHR